MTDGRKALTILGALALVLGGAGLGYVSAQPDTLTPDSLQGQMGITSTDGFNGF